MKQIEPASVQIRLNRNVIISEGIGPCVIWVTPTRARQLIDAGAAITIQQHYIGPGEIKPEVPTEKKFSIEAPTGPLTDSVQSETYGQDVLSFASVADQASQSSKSKQSGRRTKKGK